jgi:hypothetical protein
VRHQDEVYIEYESGETEYYDLKIDPYQLENRPQDAPQAMKDELGLPSRTAPGTAAGKPTVLR